MCLFVVFSCLVYRTVNIFASRIPLPDSNEMLVHDIELRRELGLLPVNQSLTTKQDHLIVSRVEDNDEKSLLFRDNANKENINEAGGNSNLMNPSENVKLSSVKLLKKKKR